MHPSRFLITAALLSFLGSSAITSQADDLVTLPGSLAPVSAGRSAHSATPATSPVSETTPIQVSLTLPLRNQAALEKLVLRLYQPGDPLYGHYLTADEFITQFGPTEADYEAVAEWAKQQGLTIAARSRGRTMLTVAGTSAQLATAFQTHFSRGRTAEGRDTYTADANPRVSRALAAKITGVVGLDSTIIRKPHLARRTHEIGGPRLPHESQDGTGEKNALSPSDIHNAYHLTNAALDGTGQTIALYELAGFYPDDITFYANRYGLGTPNIQAIPLNHFQNGLLSDQGSIVEVELDIELALALAPKATLLVYQADNSSAGNLAVLTRYADDNLAKVMSVSFGTTETSVPAVERVAEYQLFLRMAAQGQSVFASAGDYGAYDDPSLPHLLNVDDPGSQPFVTSVGGTSLFLTQAGGSWSHETTWNNDSQDAGGGGISRYWPLPSYQSGLGASSTMRNVPDVALNADVVPGYSAYVYDTDTSTSSNYVHLWEGVGGTSASTPLWAAFYALANQQRIASGGPPLGYANSVLYAQGRSATYPNLFHDIADNSTNLYYKATPGYDNATGWGSFNGDALLNSIAGTQIFLPGLQMVSTPYDYTTIGDFAAIFGLTPPLQRHVDPALITWSPASSTYQFYPDAPADTLRPGQGYWLYIPTTSSYSAGLKVQGAGSAVSVSTPYQITLAAGWNLIGDPFLKPAPLASITVSNTDGSNSAAFAASPLIRTTLYTLFAGASAYTTVGTTGSLQPWFGYWIYANQPALLTIPVPSSSQ